MTFPTLERRLLQGVIVLACAVPLFAGGEGVMRGAMMFDAPIADLSTDSHVRYLSGLLLGIGIAFLTLVPRIEAETRAFRMLGAIVVLGGLARAGGLLAGHIPSAGHVFGLAMELGVVPLLVLWQARVARRWRTGRNDAGAKVPSGR